MLILSLAIVSNANAEWSWWSGWTTYEECVNYNTTSVYAKTHPYYDAKLACNYLLPPPPPPPTISVYQGRPVNQECMKRIAFGSNEEMKAYICSRTLEEIEDDLKDSRYER